MVLIAGVMCITSALATENILNISPIDKKPPGFVKIAKYSELISLTGTLKTIPMGGAQLILQSLEKGTIILFRPYEIAAEDFEKIERMELDSTAVQVTGTVSTMCSSQELKTGILGCLRLDTSKKVIIKPRLTSNSEKYLIEALRLKNADIEKQTVSKKAIETYAKQGSISKNPIYRADYVDYYLVKKPTLFLGHSMVMIENEYMSEYMGCCVSPGVEVVFEGANNFNNINLRTFAQENNCEFSVNVDMQKKSLNMGLDLKPKPGKYSSINCRKGL